MICPRCNSSKVNRAGIRRSKPALLCRDCGYQFVQDALPVGRPQLSPTPPCIHCEGETRKRGKDRHKRQRFECKECKRVAIQKTLREI